MKFLTTSVQLHPGEEETLDSILDGKIQILQNKKGYRFALDGVLLAHFVSPQLQGRVMDLGTGMGIVALLLAHTGKPESVHGLEIQPGLADLARRNAVLNRLDHVLEVFEDDLRKVPKEWKRAGYDWVVCNPPYYALGAGRVSTNAERAVARHEVASTLEEVVAAMAHLVNPQGKVALVYRSGRVHNLFQVLPDVGLRPVRVRFIHPFMGAEAELVLVEAACIGIGTGSLMVVEAPLVIHEREGVFTREAHGILWGDGWGNS